MTAFVVTGKVAVSDPDGTVTLDGTLAADVLLLESVTTVPLAGATPFKVTVPVEDAPPISEFGFMATEVIWLAGVTVPITAISARPMFWPTAPVTVNVIDLTVLAENETIRGVPSFGNAPTGTVLPSLKVKVPEVTLSVRFVRS